MYLKHNFPYKLKKAVINNTPYPEIYYCTLRLDLVRIIFPSATPEYDTAGNLRIVSVKDRKETFSLRYSAGTSKFE